jgi:hypothetical protein
VFSAPFKAVSFTRVRGGGGLGGQDARPKSMENKLDLAPSSPSLYFDSALRVVKRKGGGSKGGWNWKGDGKSSSNIKGRMNVFASLWLFTTIRLKSVGVG